MSLVVSPKTGRLIKVGGKTFKELMKDPKYRDSFNITSESLPSESISSVMTPREDLPTSPPIATNIPMPLEKDQMDEIMSMPFHPIPTLEETLAATKQPAKREKIMQMIEKERSKEGRGIKTRGWSSRSPTRGRERHQLKAECGDKCFLLPGQEKFPICASPRTTGGRSKCEIDCGGVQAALVRSRQWGYDDVAEKAEKILDKCNQEGLEHFVPSPKKLLISPISPLPPLPSPKLLPSLKAGGRMDKDHYHKDRHYHDYHQHHKDIMIPQSLSRYGNMDSDKTEISRLLKNPPSSWRKMFREEGISETPSVKEVLSLLGSTAGGNLSYEKESCSEEEFTPPKKVREEAMKGIRLSHQFNYPSYKGIGLARAIQLVVQPSICKKSVERMNAFFRRNARYQNLSGFGDDQDPSKSYLAWLNWGGTSGKDWAESL